MSLRIKSNRGKRSSFQRRLTPAQLEYRARLSRRSSFESLRSEDYPNTTRVLPGPGRLTPGLSPSTEVYLVGTNHYSKESAEEVARLIEALQPDAVVVELCDMRARRMRDQLSSEEPAPSPDTVHTEAAGSHRLKQDVRRLFRLTPDQILGRMLGLMDKKLQEVFGNRSGNEFRAAIHASDSIPGCELIAADAPIRVTRDRLLNALSHRELLAGLIKLGKWLRDDADSFFRNFKQLRGPAYHAWVAAQVDAMRRDAPKVHRVLVEERDERLASQLMDAALHSATVTSPGQRRRPAVIIGVVGQGHVSGVTARLSQLMSRIGQEFAA